MSEMFRMLPGGNIEMTIALLPDAYAALRQLGEDEKLTPADAVSLALMSLNEVAKAARKNGTPLTEAIGADAKLETTA